VVLHQPQRMRVQPLRRLTNRFNDYIHLDGIDREYEISVMFLLLSSSRTARYPSGSPQLLFRLHRKAAAIV
jgi:hypothetical protein